MVDTREEDAGLVRSWLSGYTRADLTAQSSNDVTFVAYKKTFEAGEKVVLGTNGMTGNVINYTVFVKAPEVVTTTTTTETTTTTTTTTTTETTTTTTEATTTTIPETTATTETTQPPVTSMPPQEVLWGDANCDGNVDMSDAVLIMQVFSNPDKYGITGSAEGHITEKGRINGDVSENGNGLTNKDALAIQKFCLELIDKLPEA